MIIYGRCCLGCSLNASGMMWICNDQGVNDSQDCGAEQQKYIISNELAFSLVCWTLSILKKGTNMLAAYKLEWLIANVAEICCLSMTQHMYWILKLLLLDNINPKCAFLPTWAICIMYLNQKCSLETQKTGFEHIVHPYCLTEKSVLWGPPPAPGPKVDRTGQCDHQLHGLRAHIQAHVSCCYPRPPQPLHTRLVCTSHQTRK